MLLPPPSSKTAKVKFELNPILRSNETFFMGILLIAVLLLTLIFGFTFYHKEPVKIFVVDEKLFTVQKDRLMRDLYAVIF